MSRVIFLDLARNTGIAKDSRTPGVPFTYVLRLPGIEGDKDEGREYGAAYAKLREHISDLITVECPDAIGFEAAINVMGIGGPAQRHTTNISTVRSLYGLASIAEEVGWTMGVKTYEVAISTLKKFTTGNGRAEKRDMIKMVKLLGIDVGEPPDDNRADAAAGWLYLKSISDKSFRPGAATELFGRRANS